MEEHTAPAPIQIDEEMRAAIEEKRTKAITRRNARQKQIDANKVKAASTKKRRIELNEHKRRLEFAEYRKLHDPFYSDDEGESDAIHSAPRREASGPGSASSSTTPWEASGQEPVVGRATCSENTNVCKDDGVNRCPDGDVQQGCATADEEGPDIQVTTAQVQQKRNETYGSFWPPKRACYRLDRVQPQAKEQEDMGYAPWDETDSEEEQDAAGVTPMGVGGSGATDLACPEGVFSEQPAETSPGLKEGTPHLKERNGEEPPGVGQATCSDTDVSPTLAPVDNHAIDLASTQMQCKEEAIKKRANSLPVCRRSVSSTDPMPCRCKVCRDKGSTGSSQKAARIETTTTAEVHEVVCKDVCKACGHELGDEECCTNESVTKKPRLTMGSDRAGERQKQAEVRRLKEQARVQEVASVRPTESVSSKAAGIESATKKPRLTAGSGRAGERQKQAEAKRLKEQARLREAASIRPREIPSLSAAVTTAQKSLAKLRDRVNAKED